MYKWKLYNKLGAWDKQCKDSLNDQNNQQKQMISIKQEISLSTILFVLKASEVLSSLESNQRLSSYLIWVSKTFIYFC
jgi:hypothetical protein